VSPSDRDGPQDAGPDAEARPDTEDQTPPSGAIGLIREHPWITGIMLACTLGGALAGPRLFDDDWSLLRQVAAGGFGGAWVGITITVTKMIGD
jgi:hypothetical protein